MQRNTHKTEEGNMQSYKQSLCVLVVSIGLFRVVVVLIVCTQL